MNKKLGVVLVVANVLLLGAVAALLLRRPRGTAESRVHRMPAGWDRAPSRGAPSASKELAKLLGEASRRAAAAPPRPEGSPSPQGTAAYPAELPATGNSAAAVAPPGGPARETVTLPATDGRPMMIYQLPTEQEGFVEQTLGPLASSPEHVRRMTELYAEMIRRKRDAIRAAVEAGRDPLDDTRRIEEEFARNSRRIMEASYAIPIENVPPEHRPRRR